MPKYTVLAIIALSAAFIALLGVLISTKGKISGYEVQGLGIALSFVGGMVAIMTGLVSLALYVAS